MTADGPVRPVPAPPRHYSDVGSAGTESQNGVTRSVTHRRAKRPKREKDNQEYLAFLARAIRGAARRVIAEDPSTLAEMVRLRRELDQAIDQAARSLHEQNWSWGEIAFELGIPRQDAWRKWGKPRG